MTAGLRRLLRPRFLVPLAVLVLLSGVHGCMFSMPGRSHAGPLPTMTGAERALSARLRSDVDHLAVTIGLRSVRAHTELAKTADWVDSRFREAGLSPSRQTYSVNGKPCSNVEAEIAGSTTPAEIVIVGGHYDSVIGSPGANDNGTGTAATLALASSFARSKPARTLRFVAFVNEEPPWFRGAEMGSVVYARRSRERGEHVVAMLSLETIGYYSDAEGSQHYPAPLGLLYPSTGNFVAFVGNLGSRSLVRRCVKRFRETTAFPSEGAALPGWLPGVGWSDHESFWKEGYDAVMVTDTAPFRYPHYHTMQDTPDKIDFDRCARVVMGLEHVVRDLAGIDPSP